MSKVYYNIKPKSVLRYFEHMNPCNCHNRNDSTRYNVRIETAAGKDGTIISEIHVECLACGYERIMNVEGRKVYEKDFILD